MPHVSYVYEPDITDFYPAYETLAAAEATESRRISFNTIMLKVLVEGLLAVPKLNSLIEYDYSTGSEQIP